MTLTEQLDSIQGRVKAMRKKKRLSYRALSDQLGNAVPASWLSALEKNSGMVTGSKIYKLAKWLDEEAK